MVMPQKKRAVVSYENMSSELSACFAEKYPKGYSDFFPDIKEYPKPDGTSFYAVTVETEEAIYLVKIKIKVDDADELARWLDNAGDDTEDEPVSAPDAGGDLPDDNISQYSSGDDDSTDA